MKALNTGCCPCPPARPPTALLRSRCHVPRRLSGGLQHLRTVSACIAACTARHGAAQRVISLCGFRLPDRAHPPIHRPALCPSARPSSPLQLHRAPGRARRIRAELLLRHHIQLCSPQRHQHGVPRGVRRSGAAVVRQARRQRGASAVRLGGGAGVAARACRPLPAARPLGCGPPSPTPAPGPFVAVPARPPAGMRCWAASTWCLRWTARCSLEAGSMWRRPCWTSAAWSPPPSASAVSDPSRSVPAASQLPPAAQRHGHAVQACRRRRSRAAWRQRRWGSVTTKLRGPPWERVAGLAACACLILSPP